MAVVFAVISSMIKENLTHCYGAKAENLFIWIPIYVLDGVLDHSNALIEFGKPFIIKHVVNTGLDHDENSFVTATTGLDQFQTPLDKDGYIYDKSRWAKAGEEAIELVLVLSMDIYK